MQGYVYYSDRFWNVSWTKQKQKKDQRGLMDMEKVMGRVK